MFEKLRALIFGRQKILEERMDTIANHISQLITLNRELGELVKEHIKLSEEEN